MNKSNNYLKISVITPSFNQAQFIERTIQSVLGQNYPHLEYIVIDGGSTDDTLTILKKYQARLDWFSEADKGQVDAINKGFKKATGDIVCWLNADDEFLPNTLQTVANYFNQHPRARLLYGDAEAIDESGRSYGLRGNVKPTTFEELVMFGDFIVQPAAFWRSELINEVGFLDESLNYCLDYEYWLRVSQKFPLHYLPIPLARERFHPQAKTTQATFARIQEIEAVARRYGGPDIPHRFRSERMAIYFMETLRQLSSANWGEAAHYWKAIFRELPPSLHFFPHFFALLLGPKGVSRLRLYHDWLRNKLR